MLEGPWKDIPVVYGMLSRQDTAHYLRVERAFLPAGGDARAAALIADSLYYDESVVVSLEDIATGKVYNLERVDGNLEGYQRTEGAFAQAPNILYKIRAADLMLEEGQRMRFILNRPGEKPPVTAETTILEDLIPRQTAPPNPVNMGYDRQLSFAWSAGPAARLFTVRLHIRYLEAPAGDPSRLTPRSVEWVLADRFERSSSQERLSVEIEGEEFYRFLGEAIPADPLLIRLFEGMDLEIAAAGQELVDLLQVNEANIGLTSFQSVPIYSNLSEGRGIFSSRAFARRKDLMLTAASLDSLRQGVHTRALNFR